MIRALRWAAGPCFHPAHLTLQGTLLGAALPRGCLFRPAAPPWAILASHHAPEAAFLACVSYPHSPLSVDPLAMNDWATACWHLTPASPPRVSAVTCSVLLPPPTSESFTPAFPMVQSPSLGGDTDAHERMLPLHRLCVSKTMVHWTLDLSQMTDWTLSWEPISVNWVFDVSTSSEPS